MGELAKTLNSEETICVLDLGSTSPANIRYCTERGHRIYSEDLLEASTEPSLAIKDSSAHQRSRTGRTLLSVSHR
ncbi:MAG: hypothetical protein DMG91_17885 [Acidobacteria bacterium]|nr:MAG: hypothetical protein DMG91_17885 [Acidobacteriota bacterium]